MGEFVEVEFAGKNLSGAEKVNCNHPGIRFEQIKGNRFKATVDSSVPPGLYDVQMFCKNGISSTRAFYVTRRKHVVEPADKAESTIELDTVINGRIAKGGEVDVYRFQAKRDQRVVVECWAHRVDSSLRTILELHDSRGRRLASNRGYFGIDPLICFDVPKDGEYTIRVYDLVYSGSSNHVYRLDVSISPRVVFAVPPVVPRGRETDVTLYGWNLGADGERKATGFVRNSTTPSSQQFETRIVRVTPSNVNRSLAAYRRPSHAMVDAFSYYSPNADYPILLDLTDVPVCIEQSDNHSPEKAQTIKVPCELSGRLTRGDERDWYRIEARRGEVFYFEAFGDRIDSPVDLDLSIWNAEGKDVLAQFHDQANNLGGLRFPSNHFDPSGRWVATADGSYLVVVRNLTGGLSRDPRRVYRLSVRREVPDARLVAIARQPTSPAGINVTKGGRELLDVLAFRRRGLNEAIRVSARNLPTGVQCPDIWLGPGVASAPLVLSATDDAKVDVNKLELVATSPQLQRKVTVQAGTMVRSGLPNGSGRLTGELPWSVSGEAPLRIMADGNEKRDHHLYGELEVNHAPGGILDVAIHVQRKNTGHRAPVKLIGVGLPKQIASQTATIPAGQDKGYISFYLPPSLPVGRYTLAVKAETTVPTADGKKTQTETVYSNPVVFDVHPPVFHIELDPYAPRRAKRGEVIKVNYTCRRMNGFISKIHTELAAPGKVTDVGNLRGRGVSFVGQTESGTVQIIVNEDAELGRQKFLRLYAVGVLEDEARFHGSCFLPLEIVE